MNARRLVLHVTVGLVYTAVYWRCYVVFLNPQFEYAGYSLYSRGALFLAFSVVMAVLPVVFYRGVTAVSSVIAVLIYFILYVPIILTFALGSGQPTGRIALIEVVFLCGMSLLFLADAVNLRSPVDLDSAHDLMPAILALTIVATAYMAFVYRGTLHFVSLDQAVYVQRAATESLGSGLLGRYASSWLSTVLVPLCFAYGLWLRRPVYLAAAIVGCLILYMGAANKIMILLPFVYVGFFLMTRRNLAALYQRVGAALSLLMLTLGTIAQSSGIVWVIAATLLSRTIGNGGLMANVYYDFFSFHPQTDYSHVHGLNVLIHRNPYGDLLLGQVVGQFYYSADMNANASFWVTDGIAALGLPGVLVVSIACAILFIVINTVTREYNTLFATLCFLPFVTILLNQSLFSSFWSGGAFFLLLFFLFNRRSPSLMRPVPVVLASETNQ